MVLAGISQGCVVGIFALLASGMQIGGFVGLCGLLPLAEELNSVMCVPGRAQDVTKTPVLFQHRKDDQVVPVENGEDLRKRLEEMIMQVKFDRFDDGGHWLNEPLGMDRVVRFIQKVFQHVQDIRQSRQVIFSSHHTCSRCHSSSVFAIYQML